MYQSRDTLRGAALLPAIRKSFLTSLLSITVFSMLLFRQNPLGLSIWLGMRVVCSIACMVALAKLRPLRPDSAVVLRSLTILMAVSGVVWGLLPLLVRTDAPEWRAVVVLWLFGNQSVLTAVCAPSRSVFMAAMATVTVTGSVSIASQGGSFSIVLAGLLLLGDMYSLSIFVALHRSVNTAMDSQLRAADLASSLQRQQLELSEANKSLADLAHKDALTGLPNRRAFEHQLTDGHGRLREFGWLGIIDIDHFKDVNDSFGHGAGDLVISSAAARWRNVLTDEMVIARLGGDEFVLALPDMPESEAGRVGRELLAALSDPIAVDNNFSVEISSSIGIVAVAAGEQLATALAQADVALYEVKDAGRNDVVVIATATIDHGPPGTPPQT